MPGTELWPFEPFSGSLSSPDLPFQSSLSYSQSLLSQETPLRDYLFCPIIDSFTYSVILATQQCAGWLSRALTAVVGRHSADLVFTTAQSCHNFNINVPTLRYLQSGPQCTAALLVWFGLSWKHDKYNFLFIFFKYKFLKVNQCRDDFYRNLIALSFAVSSTSHYFIVIVEDFSSFIRLSSVLSLQCSQSITTLLESISIPYLLTLPNSVRCVYRFPIPIKLVKLSGACVHTHTCMRACVYACVCFHECVCVCTGIYYILDRYSTLGFIPVFFFLK